MTHDKDMLADGDDTRRQGVQVFRASRSVRTAKEMKNRKNIDGGPPLPRGRRPPVHRAPDPASPATGRPVGVEGEGGGTPPCRSPPSTSPPHHRSPPRRRRPQSCAPPDLAYKPWRWGSRPYRVGSPTCGEEPAANASPTLDLCDGGGEEVVRGRGAGEARSRETLSTLNEQGTQRPRARVATSRGQEVEPHPPATGRSNRRRPARSSDPRRRLPRLGARTDAVAAESSNPRRHRRGLRCGARGGRGRPHRAAPRGM
jgi:hypothetical protein